MIPSLGEIAQAVTAFVVLCTFIQNWRQSQKLKIAVEKVDEVHKLSNSMKDELVVEVRQTAMKNGLVRGIAAGLEKGRELGMEEAKKIAETEMPKPDQP